MFIKIVDAIAALFFLALLILIVPIALTILSIQMSVPIVIGTIIGSSVLLYYITKWILRDVFIMLLSIVPGIICGVPQHFCAGLDELPLNANVIYMFLYPCYRGLLGIILGPIDYYNRMRTKLCRTK